MLELLVVLLLLANGAQGFADRFKFNELWECEGKHLKLDFCHQGITFLTTKPEAVAV